VRILYLTPWFPSPPTNGSKIRIHNLVSALGERHEVTLISLVREGEAVERAALEGICRRVVTVQWDAHPAPSLAARLAHLSLIPQSILTTHSPLMQAAVRQAASEARPDILVASETETARYVDPALSFPCLLDDFEVGVLDRTQHLDLGAGGRLRARLGWVKVRRYFRNLLRRFAAATVVSEQERAYLRQIAPGFAPVLHIPNGVDTARFRPGIAPPERYEIVYNGALTYSANYDAMQYFLGDILPRLTALQPQAHLTITGSTQGVDLAGLALSPAVKLSGFLDDVRPVVAGARVCVVPLRAGGGTRLKILEAMALGTPVVSTTKGAEGLQVQDGVNILLADEPETFARQVAQVMDDDALHARLAREGRKLVEQCYDWTSIRSQFVETVESIKKRENR